MRFRIGCEIFGLGAKLIFGGKVHTEMRFRIRCTVREFKILNERKSKNPLVVQSGQADTHQHCTGPHLPNGAHPHRPDDITCFLHSLRCFMCRPLLYIAHFLHSPCHLTLRPLASLCFIIFATAFLSSLASAARRAPRPSVPSPCFVARRNRKANRRLYQSHR